LCAFDIKQVILPISKGFDYSGICWEILSFSARIYIEEIKKEFIVAITNKIMFLDLKYL